MFIGMRGDIMFFIFQIRDDPGESGIPEKISGEKEGGFYSFFFECLANERSAVREFMTGKDQRDIFPCAVAADKSALISAWAPA
jgi:hypothetical protein